MKSTHIGEAGEARMVDVGAKMPTGRRAAAQGTIRIGSPGIEALSGSGPEKGDVLGVARLAGIMAAKKTHELIPLCHPIPIDSVSVDFEIDAQSGTVTARAEVGAFWKTGVEMEALTAVSVALLTVYDMLKSVDKSMVIGEILLLEKDGGRSGLFRRGE